MFDWNPGDGASTEAQFTALARGRGVVTPIEVATRSGDFVAETAAGRLRVFTWVDVGPATAPPRPTAVLAEFGAIVGMLHEVAPASDGAIDAWYVQPPAADSWDPLLEAALRSGASWSDGLARARDTIATAGEWAASSPVGSRRICHRDLDPTNVLPSVAGGLVVLDWENLGPLPPDREVAVALFDWTTDGSRQREQVRAFRDAYLASGGCVTRLEPRSFATLVATNLNHLHMQVQAALDPGTSASDLDYANTAIPKLIPQSGDAARIEALVDAWND